MSTHDAAIDERERETERQSYLIVCAAALKVIHGAQVKQPFGSGWRRRLRDCPHGVSSAVH